MSARKSMEIDNDAIAACKKKLLQFRVKELKDVLSQAGLSKQGKKQDLTDRILALLYDEGTPGVLKNLENGKEGLLEIIDETYRIMQEGNDSNTKKHSSSSSSRARPKEEVDEPYQVEKKIRCPCGSDSPFGTLVQCMDPDCNVWQHSSCVIIPERVMEKISIPTQFFCEICRVKRADPFWAIMAHPLYPVKLVPSNIPVDGTNPHVSVEKTFKLTRADRDLLQKTEYCIQVWCMLINDIVPLRIQWPQYVDLQVNGNPLRTVSRPASQQLGVNGRDDGVKITSCIVEGVNKISLSFTDARNFCFGVRLLRRRTLEQVFGMIPKETDGERFEDALARIQRCIGGGITAGNDDSDSDLEVIADSVPVSLRCPMSGSRMKTAGRFRPCAHMGCFDLETFVGINELTRKWQCPICLKNYSLEDIIVDPFFNLILKMMGSVAEEVNEIDMKPDGCWRVKKAREAGHLSKWHKPDGSVEDSSRSESGKEDPLGCNASSLDIQNNVGEPQHMCEGHVGAENYDLNIITMSSTTTGNVEADENPSINQNGAGQLDASCSNEPEICSGFNGFGQNHGINEHNSGFPASGADIIVLSDSEDDDVSLIYPESDPVVSQPNFEGDSSYSPPKNVNLIPSDAPAEGPPTFDKNGDGYMISQPPFPYSLEDSGVGYFGTSAALADDHDSTTRTRQNNGMSLLDTTLDPESHVADSCDPQNSASNHHLPSFTGDNTLEARPNPSDSRDELLLVNSSGDEQWNFLNGGGNGHLSSSSNVDAQHESACEILVDLQNQSRSKEGSLVQRTDDDSGSRSPSGSGSDLSVKRRRSDGPFSFPRQPRSTRLRAHKAASSSFLSK